MKKLVQKLIIVKFLVPKYPLSFSMEKQKCIAQASLNLWVYN